MLSLGHCETDTHNHTHTVKFQLILFSGPVKLLASNYSGHQQRPLLWGKAHTWADTHSHVCTHSIITRPLTNYITTKREECHRTCLVSVRACRLSVLTVSCSKADGKEFADQLDCNIRR